jgi:hypothetical protein
MTTRASKHAERERIAQWMIANSLATGHGDTIEDLLGEAAGQIKELHKKNAELVAERNAAREHGVQARLREKAAEDKRIHDTDALRAQNAELVAALKEASFWLKTCGHWDVAKRSDAALAAAGHTQGGGK